MQLMAHKQLSKVETELMLSPHKALYSEATSSPGKSPSGNFPSKSSCLWMVDPLGPPLKSSYSLPHDPLGLYSNSSSSENQDIISVGNLPSGTNDKRVRFSFSCDEDLNEPKLLLSPHKDPLIMPIQDYNLRDPLSDLSCCNGNNNTAQSETLTKVLARNGGTSSAADTSSVTRVCSAAVNTSSYASSGTSKIHQQDNHNVGTCDTKWHQFWMSHDKGNILDDDDDDTASFDSQKTAFSESELDKTQEDIDRERPPMPDWSEFDHPWKIISEEEADDLRKTERLRREAAGEDTSDLNRPEHQYGFESFRLIAGAFDSSSKTSKIEHGNSEPAGILKKLQMTNLSKQNKVEAKVTNTGATLNLPQKVRFYDSAQSAHIKYVKPLPNIHPIWKYPLETEPLNPLTMRGVTRTYKLTSPAPKFVEVLPTYKEQVTATSNTKAEDIHVWKKTEKKYNKELFHERGEKPKYVVEAEELDMVEIEKRLETILTSEKPLPKPNMLKCSNFFKQEYAAGLQPAIMINTNNPPPRHHSFNGRPQVAARYAREFAGIYPETAKIKTMLAKRQAESSNHKTTSRSLASKKLISNWPQQAKQQHSKKPRQFTGKRQQPTKQSQAQQPQLAEKSHKAVKLLQIVIQPTSIKRPSTVVQTSSTNLPSIKQPSLENHNPNDSEAHRSRRRDTVSLLEKNNVKVFIKRTEAKLKGIAIPRPILPKTPPTYFTQHGCITPPTYFAQYRRINYGKKLQDPRFWEDL